VQLHETDSYANRPPGRTLMTYRILIVFLVVVILVAYQQVKSQNNSSSFNGLDLVDKDGNIRRPADVRDTYQALGTFSVVDLNGDTELHYTYASPGTAEYYRKNGKFGEGTVLVKEVFATDHGQMTTGEAHWASGPKGWFVMIKDQKGRGQPLWGYGWRRALCKSDAPDKQVSPDFKKDCRACHVPAKATEWVYVQGYPVLKSK